MNADSIKKHGLKEKVEEIGVTASGKDTTMKDYEEKARSKIRHIMKSIANTGTSKSDLQVSASTETLVLKDDALHTLIIHLDIYETLEENNARS
ncbi:hypothetical protein DUI87_11769 [Hirundo rustica rustica]|uniref:Uncharacterized protein n=1 Tax=Hirundo rustica rustica TaxID=333673 RepID=A0A3M0KX09_HIRRU|nr:hypothetical protein DUI87_11769 [Hirundo rustica rustica]